MKTTEEVQQKELAMMTLHDASHINQRRSRGRIDIPRKFITRESWAERLVKVTKSYLNCGLATNLVKAGR